MRGKREQTLPDAATVFILGHEALLRIECALKQHLPLAPTPDLIFNEALQDAVFPGGKRFRPALALLASDLVLADEEDALKAAVAVEYLHCSALIFDDLPAMDDAMERRRHPCLHLRYGEGLAITVALALMNGAYRLVVGGMRRDASTHRALAEMTRCVGDQIIGQAADLSPSSTRPSSESPCDGSVHHWKTSALLHLALALGPILSGAKSSDVTALGRFGQLLGEAYQTIDDSQDVDEDSVLLRRGRDKTFAMEHGHDAARERADALKAEAQCVLIAQFGDSAAVHRLCEFARSF